MLNKSASIDLEHEWYLQGTAQQDFNPRADPASMGGMVVPLLWTSWISRFVRKAAKKWQPWTIPLRGVLRSAAELQCTIQPGE